MECRSFAASLCGTYGHIVPFI